MRPAAIRGFLFLAIMIMVSGFPSLTLLAQEATPSTDGARLASSANTDRTDLAAMAPTAYDLPTGYVNVDERYFLTTTGVATFVFSGTATPEEVAATGMIAMYDSFFLRESDGNFILTYIAEFASPEDVEAGFNLIEDESRIPEGVKVLSAYDLPGPPIGESPSEMTVATVDYRNVGGSIVEATSVAFRVDTYLVGVLFETQIPEDAATPVAPAGPVDGTPGVDPGSEQIVNGIASIVSKRVQAVSAGEDLGDIDPSLPPLLLPTDQTWPNPGVTAEGYKDAGQILGTDTATAGLRDAFLGGYGRTVAPGTTSVDPYPRQPFVTIGFSAFDAPDTAMTLLETAGDLPVPGPLPPLFEPEQAQVEMIEGTDATSAFVAASGPGGQLDSARVAFVNGDYFVTIDVQMAPSEDVALDTAVDLATQQAACLSAGSPCQELTPPASLEPTSGATPAS